MGGEGDALQRSVRPSRSARSFPLIDTPRRDLLCAMAYVYLACGQNLRALVLLRLAERERPNDVGLLRVLAYALLAAGDGPAALEVVLRLESLDSDAECRAALLLLRSHALRLSGRLDDARRCFRDFLAARSQGGIPQWSA
jgi:tetratricopeptide (TPR) repeat protein